jgi:hypothetical protein
MLFAEGDDIDDRTLGEDCRAEAVLAETARAAAVRPRERIFERIMHALRGGYGCV